MHFNPKAFMMLVIAGSAGTMATAFTVRNHHPAAVTSSLFLQSGTGLSIPHRHGQPNRQFLMMGFLNDLFQGPQISPREEILKAFKDPKAIVVDVRSPGEITTKVDAKKWINAPGTLLDCPMLANEAAKLFPDKTTPIILYCASGKRSHKAATILKEQGYQQVFNAGGIGDLNYLPIKAAVS